MLDILQKVFYRSNPAREAFVEMCESDYVQKMTFDSYLYKTVVPGNPLDDIKLLVEVCAALLGGCYISAALHLGSRLQCSAAGTPTSRGSQSPRTICPDSAVQCGTLQRLQ